MKVVRHAEAGADVLQVVLHDGRALVVDEHVERISGLEIDQIRPGAEHPERAQFAAVLVRHEVVRVVGARAGVPEGPQDGSAEHAAGRRAVAAVGVARGLARRICQRDVVARELRARARRARFIVALGSIS